MESRMLREIYDQPIVSEKILTCYVDIAKACGKALQRKRHFFLLGTGASLNACIAARYAFLKYGGRLPHVLATSDVDYVLERAGEDAVFVLVSQSGRSHETEKAVEMFRQRKIEFWGITNNGASNLAQYADRTLLLEAGDEASSATKTYSATLLILYMIAAGDDTGAWDEIRRIPEDIHRNLALAAQPIGDMAKCLEQEKVVYFTGMGSHGATAAQAALMLKEKAFIHAEGLSLAEFRHGPVEVVEPGLPVVVLAATPYRVREALKKHAEYLAGLSANVFMITDMSVSGNGIPADKCIVFVNGCEEVFSHITAIIPCQLLAENIAQNRGLDVDGFRYIAKVIECY